MVVWLAPVPCSSAGRSAERTTSGTAAWLASMTAGKRFPTAVPEVVRTAAGAPVDSAKPRAVKPAERSSIRTRSRTFPAASASASAYAMGAEREPGETTTCRTPPSSSALTAIRAAARELREPCEVTAPVY